MEFFFEHHTFIGVVILIFLLCLPAFCCCLKQHPKCTHDPISTPTHLVVLLLHRVGRNFKTILHLLHLVLYVLHDVRPERRRQNSLNVIIRLWPEGRSPFLVFCCEWHKESVQCIAYNGKLNALNSLDPKNISSTLIYNCAYNLYLTAFMHSSSHAAYIHTYFTSFSLSILTST